ncbi:hypothetical protein AAVH_38142 [Aphelenchoides avenae]|nr:hypothetical protein AAVH_38142 [Aphelenchus avenae]
MYAVQRGPDEASLASTGTTKTYKIADQSKDDGYYDMDPALVPQVYIYASKVSCHGCSNIESNMCTGPAIPVAG